MTHANNIGLLIFLAAAFSGIIILIIKRWVIPRRGFIQFGLFVMAEIALLCNKGTPCQNCPLSFGACPIGTIQRLAFIKHLPFYITLVLIGITGLFLGTLTCAWVCPVGFIQDILNAVRIKEFRIRPIFKTARYLVLFLAVIAILLELRFYYLSRVGLVIFSKPVIIAGTLLLSFALIIRRPLCRIFCPIGLIYGRLNRISPIRVILDKEKCINCGNCNKVCLMGLNPVNEANTEMCVKCFNCKKACAGVIKRGPNEDKNYC